MIWRLSEVVGVCRRLSMGEFDGKRVTVMGLGRLGGGLGVARWLAGQGADVLVTDLRSAEALAGTLRQLSDLIDAGTVTLRLGEHNASDFTTCDLVVANPAVPKPWENRFLRSAKAAAIPVTTEIELLAKRLPNRLHTIGITGTAGKSTTSAMIAHLIEQSGRRVHLGGNIGGSLLAELDRIEHDDWVVLELSSAMLHWIDRWSPRVAVLTNLRPNHLDWHGSVEHYAQSKYKIFAGQGSGDCAVMSDASGPEMNPGVRRIVVDPAVIANGDAPCPGLMLPGVHNQVNAAVALRVCEAMEISGDRPMPELLSSFGGLPHRLQLAGEHAGVRFYNDSKSTTPEAAAMAVNALLDDPNTGIGSVHLIAGGYDKGIDLGRIVEAAGRCAGLYTIGATGPVLSERAGFGSHACDTLEQAFAAAVERAGAGDAVLLSPGCASWDQFDNYEQRGHEFIAMVHALREKVRT
jgi:UDP-N-acetylmuramoylalanine--D-glutamate ligase